VTSQSDLTEHRDIEADIAADRPLIDVLSAVSFPKGESVSIHGQAISKISQSVAGDRWLSAHDNHLVAEAQRRVHICKYEAALDANNDIVAARERRALNFQKALRMEQMPRF
jgi:hypothetical protein